MGISINKNKYGKIVSYRAVIYDRKTKVKQRNFARKVDAQKWYDEQVLRLKSGVELSVSFEQAYHIWFEYHAKLRQSPAVLQGTQKMYEDCFFKQFSKTDIADLRVNDVSAMIWALKDRLPNIKSTTINRYLQTLKCILNYHVKSGYLRLNVVVTHGMLPEQPEEAKHLTAEQLKTFLMHVENKYQNEKRWVYVFYLMLINTGMRVGEIIALQWGAVDFLSKTITVRRSYCHTTQQIRETTKGRKVRYVGITSSLLPELENLKSQTAMPEDLIFTTSTNCVLSLPNFKRDHYAKDLQAVGFEWIKIHEWRHSFASHFARNGGNLYDLQKLLGHFSIATTERYSHFMPENVIHQTERVAIDGKDNVIHITKYKDKKSG